MEHIQHNFMILQAESWEVATDFRLLFTRRAARMDRQETGPDFREKALRTLPSESP
jgi:hypothetical protein